MGVFLTLLGISLLIVLHEAGHFLLARACGMRVLRFSVGFGPALFARQVGETVWQFAAVPLGGYVLIDGMGPDPPEGAETDEDPRSYRNRPLWQRILVIGAGPLANWLLAAILVALLATTVGFRRFHAEDPVLGELQPEGPAAVAGLEAGDRILAINGQAIGSWDEMVAQIRPSGGKTLRFKLERQGQEQTIDVVPKKVPDGEHAVIGVRPPVEIIRLGPLQAVVAGFRGAWLLTVGHTKMLWGLIIGTQEGRLSGLPGIIQMVSAEAQKGLGRLLETLAGLSVWLCIFNLLPVPALDGGRLIFLGAEAVRRKPANPQVEGVVHAVGFILLLGLILFVSIRDLL